MRRLPGLIGLALGLLVADPAAATELRHGAEGYALTAIRGQEPERIPLVYLGTLHDLVGPGYDVHLVRLQGELAEHVGVAAGMSGSPVYIDGELVGALAYRFGSIPKDPIGGVTPIGDILDASRAAGSGRAQGTTATPIATPLLASGLTAPVEEWLAPQLEPHGFVLQAGSGPTGDDEPAADLRPGSPVGVALVRGAQTIAATGTVTWVDEGTVYAFGHPFFGEGKVELPMHAAVVIHTLADALSSTKYAQVGPEIGAIVDDRLTAIVGRTGAEAAMIPVDIRLTRGDDPPRDFHYELVDNPTFGPLLAASVLANTIIGSPGYEQKATVRLRGSVGLRDYPDLPLDMAFAGEATAQHSLAVAVNLRFVLAAIWDNAFTDVAIEKVELAVEMKPEAVLYELDTVVYDRGSVVPGQTLEIGCVLRRLRGERVTRPLTVRIPEDARPGSELILAVGSPDRIDAFLGRTLARRLQSAEEVGAVIGILQDLRPANRLTTVLYRRSGGVVSRGEAYSELPPTAAHLLSETQEPIRGGTAASSVVLREEIELDGPVIGGERIRLRVRNGEEESR